MSDGPTDSQSVHQQSSWKFYIGICSEDRELDSIQLKVVVPELTPVLSGTINADTSDNDVSLTDLSGTAIQDTVTVTNSITAFWWGSSTNRKYPDDVVKGEQVLIRKYGNSDRYYWESLGRDRNLRKLETFRLEVSNTSDANRPLTDDNTYFFEMDTKRLQRIILRTSNSNGEPHVYMLLIDTKNSKFQVIDDANNEILIESDTPRVRLRNGKGSLIDMNAVDILQAAPRDFVIKADRQIVVATPVMTEQIGQSKVTNAPNHTVNASNSSVTVSPVIGLNGAVKVFGTLVSGVLRAISYFTGDVGSAYNPTKTNISDGSTQPGGSSADTTTSGERHAAASEQVAQIAQITQAAFEQINGSIGVPTGSYTQLAELGTQSQMNNNQGS